MISIVFVSLVLLTERRFWKNQSNISWINGLCVLWIALINAAVYTMTIIALADFCSVGDHIKVGRSVHLYENLL